MTVAVIMYKKMGLSNTQVALYTSWLYLPWVIKPLWSPFIDLIKTKRWWVNAMQTLIAAAFAGVAFFIPTTHWVQVTMAFFWLLAFASATHDIAADGFYLHGLQEKEQSFFVGIRNTFYRVAMIFGQGLLVMFAGWVEQGKIFPNLGASAAGGNRIALAWSLAFYLLAGIFLALTIWHRFVLPKPASDAPRSDINARTIWRNFATTFVSFFQKPHMGLMLFFLLTYRLGESQLVKIAQPFMLDDKAAGGLALTTADVGAIYGTLGVIALLLGGILAGMVISRGGFKKWILPMALAINVPDLLYVLMASLKISSVPLVSACVALEQFGYGFGFTAYTMYLIYVAQGEHKTAHYAIGTAFMALGMMLPGMAAGWISDHIGYTMFFVWACVCTIPGIIAALLVRKQIPADFGTKTE
ncbi:MAG: MFS transporter [Bacteroidales bacterium]|nr:MFS transporter [Bacteroidales bacterium]MBQ7457831.1 MFS transporter [Bacteroidales bacterium]